MAAAAAPRSVWTADPAAGPTLAINGVGGTSSRRRPGLNLFSVPVEGAMFGSFALCIIIICVHSSLSRRRAVSRARRRLLRRTRDVPLSGQSSDVPPSAAAATSPRLGVPPPPTTILPVYVPPAPPSAPDGRAPGANSCRSTVNPTFISNYSAKSTSDSSLIVGDCPVCLEPLIRVGCGDDVRAAHACGHVFHSQCIQPWLHQRGSCPVCRCTLNSTFNSDSTSTSTSNSNSNSISTSNSNSNSTSTTTNSNSGGPVDECPLCLEPLHVGGGGARAAHVCGHTFHSCCIEWWLCHRTYCPMCSCTVRCNESLVP